MMTQRQPLLLKKIQLKKEICLLYTSENEDIISKLGNNVSVKKKIVNLLRDRGELDKKYRVIASLNNAANNKKIHFQTFVLRQYFNMVISYANKRLAVMTSNNFLLRCRDISFSTAGETGLELDVYSPVTGKVRDCLLYTSALIISLISVLACIITITKPTTNTTKDLDKVVEKLENNCGNLNE